MLPTRKLTRSAISVDLPFAQQFWGSRLAGNVYLKKMERGGKCAGNTSREQGMYVFRVKKHLTL